MKFLLIEDDVEILEFISLSLDFGWPDAQLIHAEQGRKAIDIVENENLDLILLDLGLPDISGFEVLRRVRQFSNIPIIIITVIDSEASIVKGLGLGADEYITKPFGQLELLARIKAVLRNKNMQNISPIILGSFKYYPESSLIKHGGKNIILTRTENLIIYELINNQGKVVTFEKLADVIWGGDYANSTEAIRVYIRRLRNKLEPLSGCSGLIKSKPGTGYILKLPSSSHSHIY